MISFSLLISGIKSEAVMQINPPVAIGKRYAMIIILFF
jgi:hypothetical protein